MAAIKEPDVQIRELPAGKAFLVKVWELPVRLSHWLFALSVVVLGVTGYLIGDPSFSEPTEASSVYTVGIIRFIHLVAGYVLLCAIMLRIYWGFVGNRFSRWSRMLPITAGRWRAMFDELKELMMPWRKFRVFTGHTPLANVSYLAAYLAALVAIVSGFVLHAHAHYTPFWRFIGEHGQVLFGNNLATTRLVHHLVLWFFAIFLLIHLYLVIYSTIWSKTTEIDTMVSGDKFVMKDELSPEDE